MSLKTKLADFFHFNDEDEYIPPSRVYPERDEQAEAEAAKANAERTKNAVILTVGGKLLACLAFGAVALIGSSIGPEGSVIVLAVIAGGFLVLRAASQKPEDTSGEVGNEQDDPGP